MKQFAKVIELANENGGQITTTAVRKYGISTSILSRMYKQNLLVRIAPGVYVIPTSFGDEMAALQYRFKKGIFINDSALFLHDMIDRTPDTFEMNFPLPYSNTNIAKSDLPVKIYRQSKKLYGIGIQEVKTRAGLTLQTYDMERTLCDILNGRRRSDPETIKQAMTSFAENPDKDVRKLFSYAKVFNLEKQIQLYMEVLL